MVKMNFDILCGDDDSSINTENSLLVILIDACSSGDSALVASILQNETIRREVNSTDDQGNAPLHVAAEGGYLDIVRLLFRAGADKWQSNGCGASAIQIAIFFDHLPLVKYLCQDLEKNPVRLSRDRKPLHFAAIFARARIVRWLLQRGADPNAVMEGGKTAAHLVCVNQGTKKALVCLNLLFEHGADMTIFDDEGRMPLHYVHDVSLLRAFTGSNFDLNSTDEHGWTLLHYICDAPFGREEMFRYLMKTNADIDAITPAGDSLIHLACRHGRWKIIDLLHSKGADSTLQDNLCRNPLHVALIYRRPQSEIVKFIEETFLKDDGDVDEATVTGWTPLHYASFYNMTEVQACLLRNNASIEVYTSAGHSPLHLIGTKDFVFQTGAEEESIQAALNLQIPQRRKANILSRFPLPDIETGKSSPKDVSGKTGLPWAARSEIAYTSLLNAGADCTKQDKDGNLPFFLAAATEWMDATFCMVRVAAHQGLFETLTAK